MFLESECKLKKLQEKLEFDESFKNIKRKKTRQCVTKKKPIKLISCSTPISTETLCRPSIEVSNIFDSPTINHSINNEKVCQISCSALINKIPHNSDTQLSSIINNKEDDTADNNQVTEIVEKNIAKNDIIECNTFESSVPSGATDILYAIGDDWMENGNNTIENESNNNDLYINNNYNNHNNEKSSNKCNYNDKLANDTDYSLNKNNINNTGVLNDIGDDCGTSSVEDEYDNDDLNINNSNNHDDQENNNECNDELAKDPNFSLSNELSEDQDQDSLNQNSIDSTSQSHSKKDSSIEISSLHNVPPLDIRNIQVPYSKNSTSKRTVKKYFCPYCKKLQTKFARHLELKHKTEADVQKFIHIKKGTHERAKIIAAIRNYGNLLHNTHNELNTGVFITVRQRQAKYRKTAEDYICCTNCKGFYSKLTIRLHYIKCKTTHKKGVREITVMGRRLTGYIHTSANETLRKIVFPVLRDDAITRCIKYDELIILFGNRLCERYTNTHQHDMIRAQLRLLGRYKLALQHINKEIHDFQLLFHPKNFNLAVKALRIVAKWDISIMWFKTPAVANMLTTLLKKCATTLKAECIKKQDYEKKQDVDDFMTLWHEEVPTVINKKAIEDQIKYKRAKKVILPSKQDIKLLHDYLKKQCEASLYILEKNFDLSSWKTLTECTLILIQIFNRRRAGEIERLTIADYKNQETLDKNVNPDLYEKLSEESQQYAKKFARITIRGKLGRTVPVLLNAIVIKSIDTILKYRKKAGIKPDNEYIFSVPNANKFKKKYLRACPLMRKFSTECGATIPSSLRGTTLRKQIATYTAMLNIEDTQVDTLANFMGHAKEIHKSIYRVPIPVKEMTDVSRLLKAAMGTDLDNNDNKDCDNISDADSVSE